MNTINDHDTETTSQTTVEVARYLTLGGAPVVVTRYPNRDRGRLGVFEDCRWRCMGCGAGTAGNPGDSGGTAMRWADQHAGTCRSTVVTPDPVAQSVQQLAEVVAELGSRVTAIEGTIDAGLDRIREEIGAVASGLAAIADRVGRPTLAPTARRRWWRGGAR
jgi:hypothetical protein